MPLKHFTETFLIVVLGAVIVLTGLLTATLPNLPEGALPWAVLFVLSIVYPLSLYSLFQKRRADNFFRNLHWFPALMLLAWVGVQGMALSGALDASDVSFFSWGWTLVPVVIGFFLLVLFILKVIRRRATRLVFLALILIPFTAAALLSEKEGNWEGELASVLWGADFWELDESGLLASWITSDNDDEDVDEDEDEGPTEEDEENEQNWREKLAMQKRREERIAARVDVDDEPKDTMAEKREDEPKMIADRRPETLTESGFGWAAIILTLIGGYCAALHNRMRRVSAAEIV